MHIALDFDGTVTLDPFVWLDVVLVFLEQGHKVSIVTVRDDRYDTCDLLSSFADAAGVEIYYTRGVAKAWWMSHFGENPVDIWIDDKPQTVIDNSTISPEELLEWRTTRANKIPVPNRFPEKS